ncbi:MAG: ABC transporter permease [Myxococcota bacterium]|nr:ABC transporter permease [Myxococcota bacterium]
MDALVALWGALQTAGSGLSVLFILAIAGILAVLAVVYAVAAVIVLARFARVSQQRLSAGMAGLLWSGGGAALGMRIASPEWAGAAWSPWLSAWGWELARLLPLCFVSMWLYRFFLRRGVLGRSLGLGVLPAGLGMALAFLSGASLDFDSRVEYGVSAIRMVAQTMVLGLVPLALAGLIEIRKRAEWFIAVRYLLAERRQVFISVITFICVGAVAAGVWLIVTVLSVMNGFERTWREEIVGNYAHFVVQSYYGPIVDHEPLLEEIAQVPGVVAASPYLDVDGMVRNGRGRIAPIRLRGIERVSAVEVTRLADQLIEGELAGIDPPDPPNSAPPGLVMGQALAGTLGVEVGQPIILISPQGGASNSLGAAPKLMRFQVVGLFESSFLQFDELYAFTSLPAAQSFVGASEGIEGFEVRTTDFFRSRSVADAVENELEHPFFARDWKELFPQFFRALNDNRSLMFLLLVMIMVVSAFVIVVTLMMMIMAKSSDVAILKTMGARDESIELVFAIEGAIIGLVGVALGVLAGIAVSTQLSWVQAQIEALTGVDTLPSSVYQISTLPSQVDPVEVAGVVSVALILALGATLLPSRHGARLDPVEALRDD